MNKATAKAPANIAFIKYWGKVNEKLRLPANSSISMNLSGAYTITSVDFNKKYKSDSLFLDGEMARDKEIRRTSKHLNLIRNIAKINLFAKVISRNSFPKGTGIASSASGFAALTMAAAAAVGLNLLERKLSILARIGSGSACRSIPDGFVEWKSGDESEDSYGYSLYPADYWGICDLIVIVGENSKKASSTEGHALADSSPFYKSRILEMPKKIRELKLSLKERDFTRFGEIVEAEAINMHAVMMTSIPPLYYWSPGTLDVIAKVIKLRENGLECYFTIDAGPNVHVICLAKDAKKVEKTLKRISGIKKVIVNKPSVGARLI